MVKNLRCAFPLKSYYYGISDVIFSIFVRNKSFTQKLLDIMFNSGLCCSFLNTVTRSVWDLAFALEMFEFSDLYKKQKENNQINTGMTYI